MGRGVVGAIRVLVNEREPCVQECYMKVCWFWLIYVKRVRRSKIRALQIALEERLVSDKMRNERTREHVSVCKGVDKGRTKHIIRMD